MMTGGGKMSDKKKQLADTILQSEYDMGSGQTTSLLRIGIDDGLRCELSVSWSAVLDDGGLRRVPHIDTVDFRGFFVWWADTWIKCDTLRQRDTDRLAEDMAVTDCQEQRRMMALLWESDEWRETYSGGRL